MKAETLKPFITPTHVADNNFPEMQSGASNSTQRKTNLIAIGLAIAALLIGMTLISFTLWNSMRVDKLENELQELNKIVESLQKRLGINYLDDLHDFEKEYANSLIDDPSNLDDTDIVDNLHNHDEDDEEDDEDDDDEDEFIEYSDLIKKYEDYGEETGTHINKSTDDNAGSDINKSSIGDADEADDDNDDNLFDDYEKYQDSQKTKKRKSRSIRLTHQDEAIDEAPLGNKNKTSKEKDTIIQTRKLNRSSAVSKEGAIVERNTAKQHRLRLRNLCRHKLPVLKSAKRSTRTNNAWEDITPAVHFHLHRKVTHHNTPIRLDAYPGDMYIGHPSASIDNSWQHYFNIDNGVLTIREPGLYYIYAQICYNNTHDQNGFVIFHGHKPFLQCLNTVPTNIPLKIHTCHTSGLIYMMENDTIHLRDFHSDRNVILKDANNRSFFGIIKI